MDRRMFISAVVSGLLAAPFIARAQQASKIPRIGFLMEGSVEAETGYLADFQRGLRELGYVEGQNIVIEPRHAAGRADKLPELAAELVRLKVDVLVATSTPGALAARNVSSIIPIVTLSPDPVGDGLAASLARPGGTITGVSDLHSGLISKRLQLLKEFAPSASRVAVLLNPAYPAHPRQLKDIQAAVTALGMTVLPFEVKGPDDIDRAFTTMEKERAGGLFVLGDRLLGVYGQRIAELAIKNRLPAIYTNRSWVARGGLMSYGANFTDLYSRMATYVDKILKGAKPADLPIEQPTKFELVINVKTAKALGITIPQSLLLRADEVIQ